MFITKEYLLQLKMGKYSIVTFVEDFDYGDMDFTSFFDLLKSSLLTSSVKRIILKATTAKATNIIMAALQQISDRKPELKTLILDSLGFFSTKVLVEGLRGTSIKEIYLDDTIEDGVLEYLKKEQDAGLTVHFVNNGLSTKWRENLKVAYMTLKTPEDLKPAMSDAQVVHPAKALKASSLPDYRNTSVLFHSATRNSIQANTVQYEQKKDLSNRSGWVYIIRK